MLQKEIDDSHSSIKNLSNEINRLSEEREKANSEMASIQATSDQFFNKYEIESLKKQLDN